MFSSISAQSGPVVIRGEITSDRGLWLRALQWAVSFAYRFIFLQRLIKQEPEI
ncbi:hypothetical protein M4951_06860 [Blastopirellula sp. J2-11]|uniref:hypothetical protein n=1 Tax=Blastopirellula sp. J2-11 TaxID=2943192 RepID=UPI0021C57FCA|nr:hypothetical protein [Blastopirellula sp. J2-11]UUO08031.1 hypothetical protein M4951_06860 [Blastopirellula sp. J2-11]